MFEKMRRADRMMSESKMNEILSSSEYGSLAVLSANGYPYAVPVNFTFLEGNIYIHSAKDGAKMKAVVANSKASFTIVHKHEIVPMKFTSSYESVIAFGTVNIVDNNQKKIEVLTAFIHKYAPDYIEKGVNYVNADHSKTTLLELKIQHVTGKSNNS